MSPHRFLGAALLAAAAAGCYLSAGDGTGGGTTPNPNNSNNNSNNNSTTATDLPCDVAAVLQSSCTSCHSNPPIGGAPMPLLSYADLTAKALSDPTKTVAEMCVSRMQNTTTPMPPGGGASATDVTTIQNWITAGYPQGTCTGGSNTNYNTPLTCTSGSYIHSADNTGSLMHPGGACNTCHSQQGGYDAPPIFSIAGTVYPTAHEYDDCVGVSGMQVVIMDANGNTQITLNANSSGNFTYEGTISKPYRAKVVQNGKTREMSATQTDGNCNSCHTEQGANGAPGRIMAP